ncbi:hypothetical protein, conserved [Eimeria maxima]|uniref:Uncharacterized protein n=1 Tax=Eimeria maxima TaxID=5804 RepID=U6M4M4_EIMMA|nr:hypothetical protein, conserved [Eimeria maxima]CDJ58981.1 hypothetical protein, conserved [Eimeria maxima]
MTGALHGGGGPVAVQAISAHMNPAVKWGKVCRKRPHLKFTFHERLGEPVVDVNYATVMESLTSSGFTWQQQNGQRLQFDLKLIEECNWMKAMAWEQKHPLNCEEGPLWRLRMMPSEEDVSVADESSQLFPGVAQVCRTEGTPTFPVDFPSRLQDKKSSVPSSNTSSKGKRFRTHIIGVFHHSAIDGISRKEFWDELLRAVIALSNAKVYAEYASRVKALTAATAVASQPLPNYRQQKLNLEPQRPALTPAASASSVATQTPLASPSYRWRRGSSNSSTSTTSPGTLYFRRSSAGNTSYRALALSETDSYGPYDSPSANTWCYIRRLSAGSAGSGTSSTVYTANETPESAQIQMKSLPCPPTTVLPPALNELFPVTPCVSVLRPLMCPGHNLHIKLYLLERELLKALRNPFACYYPPKRFKACGSEYQAYKEASKAICSANVSPDHGVYTNPVECPPQDKQKQIFTGARPILDKGKPQEEPAFTGLVTLRLSEALTAGLIAACRVKKMTMNGLVTTAAAVALSRMLWRRNQVMQQHSVLADLSRVVAAPTSEHHCWPLRHHSLWSCVHQQQMEHTLKAEGGETPHEVSNFRSNEQVNLDTTLNSTCASSEQGSAKAAISGSTHSPNSCETCSSFPSKVSETSPHYSSDPFGHQSAFPLVNEEIHRCASLVEPLKIMQDGPTDKANEGTNDRIQRDAACKKKGAGNFRCGWSLSHIAEMLQQLTLRSPVSGEGVPGMPSRQFARHKGPVYIYTLQAISGRRWLDKRIQEKLQKSTVPTIGRKMIPSDGNQFDEFLLQYFVVSMRSHKCSRTLAAMVAASVALSASGRSPSPIFHKPPAIYSSACLRRNRNGTSCSRSSSGSRSARSSQCLQQCPYELDGDCHNESNAISSRHERQQRLNSGADAKPAESMHIRKKYRIPGEPEESPVDFNNDKDLCLNDTKGFVETTGQSSLSTSSSLHCTFTSTLSAESLEDRAEKASVDGSRTSASSTSCSRRLHSHTRTVSSRISRGLRMITQWLWGTRKSSSNSENGEKQQQGMEQLPPFGLGSYALLMPLKLRVPTECNNEPDAIWALGKACTETVHRFVSLPNPSLATFDFQLISSFAEEIQGQLKCLHPVRDDSFARPSAFLISNGGVWAASSLSTFAEKIHEQLRAVPERHRSLLQRVLQHQTFLQQRASKKPTLPPLPSQHPGGPGAADAGLRSKCQCGGKNPVRNNKCSVRSSGQQATSPVLAAAALPASSTLVAAADVRIPADLMHSGEQQQDVCHQQQMGKECLSGLECLLWDLEGLMDSLQPFELSVDSSWSIVCQHRTGLNYFAHNCVTINGRMNWSLQYHSNLTSREIAALYAAYILEVLQEAHDLHVKEEALHRARQIDGT